MKKTILVFALGLSILAISIVAHPVMISFDDVESYKVSLALCSSGLGEIVQALASSASEECRLISTMLSVSAAAKVGWVLGGALVCGGLFFHFFADSPKKGKITKGKKS